MVIFLAILTVVLFITADYFIRRKNKAKEAAPSTMPLYKIFTTVPSGIFLQPTLTWSKILASGELAVGIHPFLAGLIGKPDDLDVLQAGEKVRKGTVLVKVRKGNKMLRIRSPVTGSITAIDKQVMENPDWDNLSKRWLYVMKPKNVAAEVPSWLIAEKAQAWTKQRYQQIKNFLMNLTPQTDMGLTMADGGDIPVGILDQFDERVWKDFETKFLH